MTGKWSLIVPESTTNYISNPSLETGTTGYTAYATGTADGTRARSMVWAKRDAWSYKIAKTSGGASDLYGFYVTAQLPGDFVSGEYCTFSVDLNVVSGTVQVYLAVVQGTTLTADTNATTDGRYSVTVGPLTATATEIKAYVYVVTETGEFYADGLQVENKAYATTYCDGTRDGCRWTGPYHASTSTRSAQNRLGGKDTNLDDLGYYISEQPGLGMPPVFHFVQELALRHGAALRGYKVKPRMLSLVALNTPSSLTDLHSKRKALIDILKPDRTKAFDPILLRYIGANSSQAVDLPVVYDDGLQFNQPDGFSEEVGLRLMAYDPVWREDGDCAAELGSSTSLTNANYVLKRQDGVWTIVSASFDGPIRAIAVGHDGLIYFGGDFTNVGDANGDSIVKYNPSTGAFTSLGTGIPNSGGTTVQTIAVAPNGDLYVGGTFTDAGGVANTANLARWDVSAGEWQSIATSGANNVVQSAVFDQNGDLFITGAFTEVDGVAKAYIAKYVISTDTWSALGTGLNASGIMLAISKDNVLYVGGNFTTANGVTVNYVAYWNGTTFVTLGTGANAYVSELFFGPDGTLYLGGNFTACNGTAGFNYLAAWNGTAYLTLGDGSASTTFGLGMDDRGLLYATGPVTVVHEQLAGWDGSSWSVTDLWLPAGGAAAFAYLNHNGVFYVGYNLAGTAVASAQTTVTNTGTMENYPQVVITRSAGTSASVQWLRNDTTGDVIYLDYDLLDGETLTIDFKQDGRTCISSYFGLVWRALSRQSDMSTFRLLPGANQISLFVYPVGSPTITAYIQWQNVHWSADGVAS